MDFKAWWKSRTIWLAALQFIAGGVIALSTAHPELGWLMVTKSIVDILLRLNTYKPVV